MFQFIGGKTILREVERVVLVAGGWWQVGGGSRGWHVSSQVCITAVMITR